ncbi:MAG: Uma2 family endonuclease [Prosthecobacter sp.]|nr:Uma2 family endonuclease [Prosthecobacter sp.]
MSAALKLDLRMTPEEFAAFEEKSDVRHEYLNGDIIAMAGGTEVHSLISCNASGELWSALKKRPCRVYESNMRIKIEATGSETYPDCSVVCGTSKFEDLRRQTLLNPLLIIEVLSESTEIYDRGKKFWNYRHIPSLQEYVLITPTEALIEVFTRQPTDEWLMRVYEGLQAQVRLDSLDLILPIASFYAKTPVVGVPLEEVPG